MSHIPGSLITDGKLALKLFGGHPLFGGANQVDRQEPLSKRQVRIVKDGPGSNRVLKVAVFALVKVADLFGFSQGLKLHHAGATAFDADRALRPANLLKIFDALFLGIKLFEDFDERGELVHGESPFS